MYAVFTVLLTNKRTYYLPYSYSGQNIGVLAFEIRDVGVCREKNAYISHEIIFEVFQSM